MKCVFIICYFGKFPSYFNLWAKSASYIKSFDFFIFTDNKDIHFNYPNIFFISTTLSKIKELASEKLGFDVVLDRPYKLCDYKAIYGFLFEEYIKNYTHWGYCDLDQIFGDLSEITKIKNIEEYDKINYWGHLSIYKNTYENNRLFMNSDQRYKEVYVKKRIFGYDEIWGMYDIYKKAGKSILHLNDFADISTIYKRFKLGRYPIFVHTYKDLRINYNKQVFYWEEGKIYRAYKKNKMIYIDSFLYIHFKKRSFSSTLDDNVRAFFIGPKGFTEKKDDTITEKHFREINPYYGFFIEWIEKCLFIIKLKCKRLKHKITMILFKEKI